MRLDSNKTVADIAPHGVPTEAWVAIFTNSRHEKKVARYLQSLQIEQFLPTYTIMRHWRNRQTMRMEFPLFPNYLFARVGPRHRSRVLCVPGVLGVIGELWGEASLPDQYVEMLRAGASTGTLLPHPEQHVGEQVRIVSGPFAGIEGTLLQVRSAMRVVVSIELIQRCVSVEVSSLEIEVARGLSRCSSLSGGGRAD